MQQQCRLTRSGRDVVDLCPVQFEEMVLNAEQPVRNGKGQCHGASHFGGMALAGRAPGWPGPVVAVGQS